MLRTIWRTCIWHIHHMFNLLYSIHILYITATLIYIILTSRRTSVWEEVSILLAGGREVGRHVVGLLLGMISFPIQRDNILIKWSLLNSIIKSAKWPATSAKYCTIHGTISAFLFDDRQYRVKNIHFSIYVYWILYNVYCIMYKCQMPKTWFV